MALRRFLSVKGPWQRIKTAPENSFSVAQFNILAGSLGASQYFPHSCPHNLAWEVRRHTLMNEMKACTTLVEKDSGRSLPDVFCLEELDNYWLFFKDEMQKIGYDSVYMERPSVHVSSWTGKKKYDGCGIFFKRNKFDIVEEESVTYTDVHDRIALMVLLRFKKSRQHVLVGNTHIYWDWQARESQMHEIMELDAAVTEMKLSCSYKYGDRDIPVVICGDFNNGPQSEVYKYMTNKFLSEAGVRMRSAYDIYGNFDGIKEEIVIEDESACGKEFEPPFTTCNFKRCWTIDYIFYSSKYLSVSGILEIPQEEHVRRYAGPPGWTKLVNASRSRKGQKALDLTKNNNGIPNGEFGSDHLPILATFDIPKVNDMNNIPTVS
eukprot:Nk52_evm6s621 gene=Nk52_evmTU6s621